MRQVPLTLREERARRRLTPRERVVKRAFTVVLSIWLAVIFGAAAVQVFQPVDTIDCEERLMVDYLSNVKDGKYWHNMCTVEIPKVGTRRITHGCSREMSGYRGPVPIVTRRPRWMGSNYHAIWDQCPVKP